MSEPPTVIGFAAVALKADGVVRRTNWRYEIVDEAAVPREYLRVDHTKLGAVVRALKTAAAIPGVRIWAEPTVAARGQ